MINDQKIIDEMESEAHSHFDQDMNSAEEGSITDQIGSEAHSHFE
jgi:hypothetical protein